MTPQMTADPNRAFRVTAAEMQARLPASGDQRFAIALERGELQVEFYVPQQVDHQKPHDQDECYVVVQGEGRFVMGDETVPFRPGDFLFVPAGMPHRFENFGDAMATWVIFYGPKGGMAGVSP